MSRFEPLWGDPAPLLMAAVAIAIAIVYGWGRRRPSAWPATVIRILSVAGLVIPGASVLGWYRRLDEARAWSRDLPVRAGPIAEAFIVNSAALFATGFAILVVGIYLARRLGGGAGDLPSSEP